MNNLEIQYLYITSNINNKKDKINREKERIKKEKKELRAQQLFINELEILELQQRIINEKIKNE